jgi:hypothetical protein
VSDVFTFDLEHVGVDLSLVPVDEVVAFRKENLAAHRHYCVSARRFAEELSHMEIGERQTAFDLRQEELREIASALASRAAKAWRKPASLALSLTAAAIGLSTANPVAAALSAGAAAIGYSPSPKLDTGSYSYIFKAGTSLR